MGKLGKRRFKIINIVKKRERKFYLISNALWNFVIIERLIFAFNIYIDNTYDILIRKNYLLEFNKNIIFRIRLI